MFNELNILIRLGQTAVLTELVICIGDRKEIIKMSFLALELGFVPIFKTGEHLQNGNN